MLRRINVRWLALALLLALPGVAGAQGGDFIRFTPAGLTGTLPILLHDGTAAAPALGFASAPNYGLYYTAGVLSFAANGISRMGLSGYQLNIASNSGIFALGASADVRLTWDAANTLALRNSTNPQAFNIYNTYTDGSNYERGFVRWVGNNFDIGNEPLGTGTGRATRILGTGGLIFTVGGAFTFNAVVNPSSIDAVNIGTAALQWKEFYLSRSIQGSKSKALTDAAAATPFTRIAVPTSGFVGGELIWTATSTDATDFRSVNGRVRFSGVNKAGTPTCTINVVGTDLTASSNANTLVCTWTNVASTTNCDLSVTCTDNTAGSQTITMNGRLDMPLTATVTPQ